MALEIRAGSNATLYLFYGQHGTATYQQGHVIDLLDEVCSQVLLVQQAENVGRGDGTPTRFAGQFVAPRSISCRDLIFVDHVYQAVISALGVNLFCFALGKKRTEGGILYHIFTLSKCYK